MSATQALAQYQALNALPNTRDHLAPDLADPQLSFQLAQAVSDLDFLSGLLRQRSETSRLKTLDALSSPITSRSSAPSSA